MFQSDRQFQTISPSVILGPNKAIYPRALQLGDMEREGLDRQRWERYKKMFADIGSPGSNQCG